MPTYLTIALALAGTAALPELGKTGSEPLAGLDQIYPDVEALYIHLHKNPELSGREEKTAATFAEKLRALGFRVATGIGGTGVVGILENGSGPTVMLRTELDALPVEEKTGLLYASQATALDDGKTVKVMHACGHDLHMAAVIGASTLLARSKESWKGTLMIVGQPAEESLGGARAMLADGLFKRFPKPDAVFGVHTRNTMPVGQVGYRKGPVQASADTIVVKIFGRGGHGSEPHTTVDPIALSARVIMGLQMIVSRENRPFDPAVVTVGSIHAGTRPNIIPDDAKMELTVRALHPNVRKKLLAAIERTVKGEAAAAGAPRAPEVTVVAGTDVLSNDAALTDRLVAAVGRTVGPSNMIEIQPYMNAEDFSEYAGAGVPVAKFYLGVAAPKAFEQSVASGVPLPSNHSPLFAPARGSLRVGIAALVSGALELFTPRAASR